MSVESENISPIELKNVVISIVGISDVDLCEHKFTARNYNLKSIKQLAEKSVIARQLIAYMAYHKLNMRGEQVKTLHKLINRKHPTILHSANVVSKELKLKGKRTEMLKHYLSLLENSINIK